MGTHFIFLLLLVVVLLADFFMQSKIARVYAPMVWSPLYQQWIAASSSSCRQTPGLLLYYYVSQSLF